MRKKLFAKILLKIKKVVVYFYQTIILSDKPFKKSFFEKRIFQLHFYCNKNFQINYSK